jgi:hypothetical protein
MAVVDGPDIQIERAVDLGSLQVGRPAQKQLSSEHTQLVESLGVHAAKQPQGIASYSTEEGVVTVSKQNGGVNIMVIDAAGTGVRNFNIKPDGRVEGRRSEFKDELRPQPIDFDPSLLAKLNSTNETKQAMWEIAVEFGMRAHKAGGEPVSVQIPEGAAQLVAHSLGSGRYQVVLSNGGTVANYTLDGSSLTRGDGREVSSRELMQLRYAAANLSMQAREAIFGRDA